MRVARRRTKRSWRTRANGLNSGQDKKCPGSSNIRPEQRQILGRVSDGGRPRRSRDARLNSRSDKERDEEGRARSQARGRSKTGGERRRRNRGARQTILQIRKEGLLNRTEDRALKEGGRSREANLDQKAEGSLGRGEERGRPART